MRHGPRPLRATVVAVLPNELFRLRTEDGTELTGHVGGDLRMGFTRLLPGDVVHVELSPFDPGRARICGDEPPRNAARSAARTRSETERTEPESE